MKASEANALASKISGDNYDMEYSQIMQKIEVSAKRGGFVIMLDTRPTSAAEKMLKADGYEIDSYSDMRESWYNIRWHNVDGK